MTNARREREREREKEKEKEKERERERVESAGPSLLGTTQAWGTCNGQADRFIQARSTIIYNQAYSFKMDFASANIAFCHNDADRALIASCNSSWASIGRSDSSRTMPLESSNATQIDVNLATHPGQGMSATSPFFADFFSFFSSSSPTGSCFTTGVLALAAADDDEDDDGCPTTLSIIFE